MNKLCRLWTIYGCLALFWQLQPGYAQSDEAWPNAAHPQSAPPLPAAAPIRPVVDTYFGKAITDPYRWMEDMKNPELLGWMKAQGDYTRQTLNQIPGREALLRRMLELSQTTSARMTDIRQLPGHQYFYLKTPVSSNVARLYERKGLEGSEHLLVDPEKLNTDKSQPTSISYYEPSPNGRIVALGLAAGGSENSVIRVVDTQTGQWLPDSIDRSRYGYISWLPDNRSFLYTRLQQLPPDAPKTEIQQKSRVYRHMVGTPSEQDIAVFGHEVHPGISVDPTLLPYVVVQPGSDHALAFVTTGVGGEIALYAAPLKTVWSENGPAIPWKKICEPSDGVTDAAFHGDDLYLVSQKGAPRYQVLQTSLIKPNVQKAEVVVSKSQAVLGGYGAGWGALTVARDGLYVQQLDGGISRLWRVPFQKTEKSGYAKLPYEGTVYGVWADPRVAGVTYTMGSWVHETMAYGYDPSARRVVYPDLQNLTGYEQVADFEVQEVKVRSHDGVMVPLSIIHRRGLKLNGTSPTWLNGYGAYGISERPGSGPLLRAWVEHGGVYAVAHVRGGGEYGEEWHRAGYKKTKPNTWKDFIACAEHLIQHKYTTAARLGGLGISAGGILMGRAMTERPDLFAAVGIAVGLTDMLRYETTANGLPNIPEFGSVATKEGFEILHQMSAYHHVRDGVRYPAVLLATGLNDARVDPWIMAKMAARLQHASSSRRPVLLRVDEQAGHGPGVTRRQRMETYADGCAFLFWQLGHPDFQPTGSAIQK